MKVPVNKIIPFSAVDGPGSRTAVFLQGCNLNCKYCHNPETIAECIACGACIESCPAGALRLAEGKVHYDLERCAQCDTCIRVCPHSSSPKLQYLSPEEVFERVKRQVPFIRGITVSGGECTRYPEFLTALFRLCRQAGLGTLIDTNGMLDFEGQEELLAVTDGVMLDLKAFTEADHIRVTGTGNRQILKNAVFLAERGKLTEIRTVIVPDLFSPEDTVRAIAELLSPYLEKQSIRYKLIAYRPMGVRKAYSDFQVPSEALMHSLEQIVKTYGFQDSMII